MSRKLDITPEEAHKFLTALKDPVFSQMFNEYARELAADPQKFEEEKIAIRELEKANPMSVGNLLTPLPGVCFKVQRKKRKGIQGSRVFVNLCHSPDVDKWSPSNVVDEKGWNIPYFLCPLRYVELKGVKEDVYDVIFRSDVLQQAKNDPQLKTVLVQTAIRALENRQDEELDLKSIKFSKRECVGSLEPKFVSQPKIVPQTEPKTATVKKETIKLESYIETQTTTEEKKGTIKLESKIEKEIESKVAESQISIQPSTANNSKTNIQQGNKANPNLPETPKYTIIHRNYNNQFAPNKNNLDNEFAQPHEIVVEISLPKAKGMSNLELDIGERKLWLEETEGLYKLELNLTFYVDGDNGNAKWDKVKKILIVTLPVIKSSKTNSESDKNSESNESNHTQMQHSHTHSKGTEELETPLKINTNTKTPFGQTTFSSSESSPAYTIRQDIDSVIVLIDTNHFSLSLYNFTHCFSENNVYLEWKLENDSLSSQVSQPFYHLGFNLSHSIIVEDSRCNVEKENTVLVLKKAKKGLWVNFSSPVN